MICQPCATLADREQAIRTGRRDARGSNVHTSHTRKRGLRCVGDGCTCKHGRQPAAVEEKRK